MSSGSKKQHSENCELWHFFLYRSPSLTFYLFILSPLFDGLVRLCSSYGGINIYLRILT